MSDPRLPFYTDRCKCPTCGEYFSSTYAFDQHRKGPITDRRCLTVAEMREKGFSVNATGHWITKPYSEGGAIGADPYPPQGVTQEWLKAPLGWANSGHPLGHSREGAT